MFFYVGAFISWERERMWVYVRIYVSNCRKKRIVKNIRIKNKNEFLAGLHVTDVICYVVLYYVFNYETVENILETNFESCYIKEVK